MKRRLTLSVLLLVAFCQHPSWAVQDPATPPLEIDHEQTINVVLEDYSHIKPNPLLHCKVIGAPVRAGTRVRFNFKISNPTTRDMVFDRVETGCGCMNMECEKPVIPANGAAIVNAVADYVVPKSHTQEEYGINIQFKSGNITVGGMLLTGPLEGVLSIPPVRALESTGDFSEWRIPFIVTKPVELNRLQVQLSENLKDLVAKVDVIDGKAVILVSGPTSSLGPAGIIGEVILSDPLLEIKTAARVSFLKRPVMRISPLIIRFTKVNAQVESYSANVLIQSVDKKVENGQENLKNLIQTINCKTDKHDLQVASTRINDQLYRVNLTLSLPEGEDVDPADFAIDWRVVSSQGVLEVSGSGSIVN